jgi:histidinol dehydrogenase
MTVEINRLNSQASDFWQQLNVLQDRDTESDNRVITTVNTIIDAVRSRGDAAVLEYTARFDSLQAGSVSQLELPPGRLQEAYERLPGHEQEALNLAASRIKSYASHQKLESWQYTEPDGTLLGQQVSAIDRAGLYVPGGKAAYPSSVLMNAIPARVAGVEELIMVVPTPSAVVNELVLAAAHISDVDRVFTIGGAQAIAALAYGTESIPCVDKIVGPGNIYVATAKRMVFGRVGIDMIAGPSEILVICDGNTDPDWIAMDLFSQAEHDEDAQAILLSPDADFLNAVEESVNRLIEDMPRRAIINSSLSAHGALVQVVDMDEAVKVANVIAPEHLELSVENAQQVARSIRHAGAIFMGRYTAEALGDYCAGPNHVLPTSRTARFSSPLGVYDFQKRSSLIACTHESASELGKIASVLAHGEGLVAHARSAEFRIKQDA